MEQTVKGGIFMKNRSLVSQFRTTLIYIIFATIIASLFTWVTALLLADDINVNEEQQYYLSIMEKISKKAFLWFNKCNIHLNWIILALV